MPLFRRVHELGIKVVLTGDGSDELFGGYPMYHRIGARQARRLFLHKIRNLGRTELQRVDRTSMASGVEARVPFLDLSLVELAMRLPMDFKMRDGQEKWILREAFSSILPDYIRMRPKNPMSHSSGLHERARLYKPFFARMHSSFGYDLLEPVRRDFSTLLDQCDHDLYRAVAEAAMRQDYTLLEHARDLAGAARWNAAAMIRRKDPGRLRRAWRPRPGQRPGRRWQLPGKARLWPPLRPEAAPDRPPAWRLPASSFCSEPKESRDQAAPRMFGWPAARETRGAADRGKARLAPGLAVALASAAAQDRQHDV